MTKNVFISIVVFCIFLISLFVRLDTINYIEYPMNGDALNYHNMANNYIDNGIFGYAVKVKADEPNAYVTPGYPLFLVGVYSVFGNTEFEDIETVKVIQAVLSALSVVLIFFIGKKIGNTIIGTISSGLMIFYPSFIAVPVFHLTETLYTFLFFIYLYLHLIAFEKNKKWMHALCGVLFGIAVMVRPAIFPFFLVIYAYKWILEKDKGILKKLLLFTSGLLVVMVPWWIRNFILCGDFIILCTQTGNPLIGGAYPPQFAPRAYPPIEEQFDAAVKAIVNGFINHPKEYIKWFTIDKLSIMFKNVYLVGFLPQLAFMEKVHIVSVFLGAIGTFAGLFNKRTRMVALYIIMIIIAQLLVIPDERYVFTVMPLLMVLAVYFCYEIVTLKGKLKKKN